MFLKVIRRHVVTRATNLIVLVAFFSISLFPQFTPVSAALDPNSNLLSDDSILCATGGPGCGPSRPDPLSPPSCSAGTLPGQAGVSCTGAGTYEIPIDVPPGSADMQPALSLTYNSQAGNGLLGMGWSINGLSSITRCAANMALDDYKGGINYDADDKFCLDGQRLVPIANSSLPPGVVEYRTEPDTFTRVMSYGTTTTPVAGADYFTAEAKSGLSTEYGKTANSKINAQGSTEVRVWAANKLTDRVGNYIEYFYNNDALTAVNGEYSPHRIRYTGNTNTVPATPPYNSVQFIYRGRPSDDQAPFYQGGSVVQVTQRLIGIRTCLSSTCNLSDPAVTQYVLQYQQSIGTRRSQLNSVQKCDSSGTNCLPATTMTWSDQGVTNLAGSTTSGNYGGGKQWNPGNLDFISNNNGSFMRSRMPIYQDAFTTSISGIANAGDVGSAVVSTISVGMTVASFIANPLVGAISYVAGALIVYIYSWIDGDYWIAKGKVGDLNGDGRIDVVGFAKKNDGPEYVWLSKRLSSSKNEFQRQGSWETKSSTRQNQFNETEPDEAKLADFNGDGLMDVLSFENFDGYSVYVYQSDGVSQFSDVDMKLGISSSEKKSIGHSMLGDFNGDGSTDIAKFTTNGHISLAKGNTFDELFSSWGVCGIFKIGCDDSDDPLNNILSGDVNGDGKADMIVLKDVEESNGVFDKHANIWFTNRDANGWVDDDDPVVYNFEGIHNYKNFDTIPVVFQPGDFNGDGKMDIAIFSASSSTWQINDTNNDGDIAWGPGSDDIAVQNGKFDVYLSTGRTFKHEPSFTKYFTSETNLHIAPFARRNNHSPIPGRYVEGYTITFLPRLADFNGDGTTDVMIFDVYKNHNAHLWLSDGSKLREEINPGPAQTAEYWGSGFGLINEDMLGDFDGDGRADVLQIAFGGDGVNYDGQLNVTLSSSYPFPDQLIAVTDGFGKKDQFEYKPITDDGVGGVYTRDESPLTGFDSETFKFQGPLYVVSKLKTSNGILPITPEGMYALDYQYYGAKSHRSHGFLGFSKIVIDDLQMKTTETLEYEQEYPLICHVKGRAVNKMAEAQLTINSSSSLSEHISTWRASSGTGPGGMPHVIRLDAETDIQYEIGGVELSNTRTEYFYEPAYPFNLKLQRTTWPGLSPVVKVEDVTRTYDDFITPTTWILGLPTFTKVERFEPVAVPARTVSRAFNSTTGLLTGSTETFQNGIVTTNYPSYDEFGNAKEIAVTGTGIPSRTTKITYEPKGRFPTSIKNPLGDTTNTVFEPEFGNIDTVTDPNILLINRDYDGFGRLTQEMRPDGTMTSVGFCASSEETYVPSLAQTVHWVKVITTGAPDMTVFYDKLGREIRTSTVGFNGTRIYSDSLYNSTLRLARASQPYYQGAQSFWTDLTYDVRDRITSETAPNGALTSYTYTGNAVLLANPFPAELTSRLLWHKVTEQNDLHETTDYIVNRLNQVNQVAHYDNLGTLISHMTYSDDAFNNPLRVADENNNITTRTFEDDLMVSLSDPDMGSSTYTYDVLGNLTSTTDANGNPPVKFSYDKLNRLTSREELESVSMWVYGTDPALKNIGRLQATSGGSTQFTELYLYDNFGRPKQVSTQIPGETAVITTERTYDPASSRVATLIYPGPDNFTVKYSYTPTGYLKDVRNNSTNALFWQANGLNAAGQLTLQTQGDTLLTSKFTYDKMFNVIDIKHGDSNNVAESQYPLKHLTYAYNSTNNLTEQRNLIRSASPLINEDYLDQFEYDPLNRLTWKFGAIDDHIQQVGIPRDEFTYEYDAIGNITYKSDLGAPTPPNYLYPSSAPGPHAVSSVEDNQQGYLFTYDLNGNMLTGRDFQNNEDRFITWYSYNKPFQISELGKLLTLTYDSYRDKIKQVFTRIPGTTTTTEYVGSIYEKVTNTAGPTEHKYYVYGDSAYPVAMYTTRTNPVSSDVRYFHYDNLGSLDLITDETGGIVEDLSFDPHGVRRNADWTAASGTVPSLTAYGYTFHEDLDEFGLIDMKGRMYDPKIGRFLSADPYITEPFMTENLNRYSYVHNSPTNFIDPSGFQTLPWGGLFTVMQAPVGIAGAVGGAIGSTVGSVALSVAGNAIAAGQSLQSSTPLIGGVNMDVVAKLSQTPSAAPKQPTIQDLKKRGVGPKGGAIEPIDFTGLADATESIYNLIKEKGKGTLADVYNIISILPPLRAFRAPGVTKVNTIRDAAIDVVKASAEVIVLDALKDYPLPNPALKKALEKAPPNKVYYFRPGP